MFDLSRRPRFERDVRSPLPIDPVLPGIVAALRQHPCVVLQADPGAGKTTRVPAAILDAGLAADREVVVLEPRRIAARAAAEYVAQQRGTKVGGEIGYRVRFETVGGTATRLWFVTEGIFARQLVSDPFLERVAVVVIDEFHERHLAGDVALATLCELRRSVRPDLRVVVMSATLEAQRVARFLDDCPVLQSSGRAFPVDVDYCAATDTRPVWDRAAAAVRRQLQEDRGDALVFLPGAAEIRRTAERLGSLGGAADVLPLHGDMPLEAQRRVIEPGPRRRVVLSTNVAETSLTIDGITTVIDSGLVRESRLDARHGINRLRTVTISRAAAEQRAGRAGRTAPGRCLRLWTRAEDQGRREHDTPEILRLDLSAMLLEVSAWGLRRAEDMPWLDAPPGAAMAHAERLLRALGAIDAQRNVTDTGRRMLRYGVEPRLARLLVEAQTLGCSTPAATLAALASERDVFSDQRVFGARPAAAESADSDLLVRLRAFEQASASGWDAATCLRLGVDRGAARAVERVRSQLMRRGAAAQDLRPVGDATLLRCIAAAYPDRVCRRRAPGGATAVMVGGTGVVLSDHSVVRQSELFVAVDVDGSPRHGQVEALVRVASAVDPSWLAEIAPGAVTMTSEVLFDAERQRVVERRRRCFLDLVLDEQISSKVESGIAGETLAAAVLGDRGLRLQLQEQFAAVIERVRFLRSSGIGAMPEEESFIESAIRLGCAGQSSLRATSALDWPKLARGVLDHTQRRQLERDAPERIELPNGRSAAIHYSRERAPYVAVRIQHAFGIRQTPRLAGGRVALVFELLAPNQRPAQVTDDLESFWKRGYPDVRKLLRGRYPKHAWPEDPFAASSK